MNFKKKKRINKQNLKWKVSYRLSDLFNDIGTDRMDRERVFRGDGGPRFTRWRPCFLSCEDNNVSYTLKSYDIQSEMNARRKITQHSKHAFCMLFWSLFRYLVGQLRKWVLHVNVFRIMDLETIISMANTAFHLFSLMKFSYIKKRQRNWIKFSSKIDITIFKSISVENYYWSSNIHFLKNLKLRVWNLIFKRKIHFHFEVKLFHLFFRMTISIWKYFVTKYCMTKTKSQEYKIFLLVQKVVWWLGK